METDDETQTPETLPIFPADQLRGVVVSQEFMIAAVELAEAVRQLSSMTSPDDVALTPRDTWQRWESAAAVILGEK